MTPTTTPWPTTNSYVQDNYVPYEGDASFLAPPTENTQALRRIVDDLCHQELEKVRGTLLRPCCYMGSPPPCLFA